MLLWIFTQGQPLRGCPKITYRFRISSSGHPDLNLSALSSNLFLDSPLRCGPTGSQALIWERNFWKLLLPGKNFILSICRIVIEKGICSGGAADARRRGRRRTSRTSSPRQRSRSGAPWADTIMNRLCRDPWCCTVQLLQHLYEQKCRL